MSTYQAENTKINSRNKLQLKRSNSDSTQSTFSSNIISSPQNNINTPETCNENELSQNENASSKSNVEDSLADFKSPKEETVRKPIFNKFRFDADKVKRKIIKSKSKSTKAAPKTKQPLIESSFFKTPIANGSETKESFPCSLCLKPFKDDTACVNHMKTCAAKNKVSIQQLLEAKKLQERQAEERKALGLLAAPAIPEKKKVFRKKNYSTEDDPQLQLVLAMSESLYEAERVAELEQAALLEGIPSECIKLMSEEDRRTTLQTFGFTTNKPASEQPAKPTKKRRLLGPTVLQTRSKEDKDRVLTERIACIITGDDAFTQARQTTVAAAATEAVSREDRPPARLRSALLKTLVQSTDRLWDRSRLTKKSSDFLVEELKSHFLRVKQPAQASELQENKGHNSEVPGEEDANKELANISVEYEPVDIDLLIDQCEYSEPPNMNNPENKQSSELDFIKNVTSSWAQTLNNSAASDIIIFVRNNKHIYAHRLVFYVHCTHILLNVETNDSLRHPKIKEKICWLQRDQLSALAFLEFIYCGCINKNISVFDKKELLSEVQGLAKEYKVENLFKYIKLKQDELGSKKQGKSQNLNNHKRSTNPQNNVNIDDHASVDPLIQQTRNVNTKKNISLDDYYMQKSSKSVTSATFKKFLKKNKLTQTSDFLEKFDTNSQLVTKKNQETQTSDLTEECNTDPKLVKSSTTNNCLLKKNQETQYLDSQDQERLNTNSILGTNVETPRRSILKNHVNKQLTASPDLFESEDDSFITCQTENQNEVEEHNTTLNMLVDLINQDKHDDVMNILTQNINTNQVEDNVNNVESSNSQETIINLSESPSLRSRALSVIIDDDIQEITPIYNSPENINDRNQTITEASTSKRKSLEVTSNKLIPKRKILEKCDNVTAEKINNANDQMATALSPPSNKSPRIDNRMEVEPTNSGADNKESEITDEKSDDSIHNAVTPPRRCSRDAIQPIITTELDLFLKKVHKINAKNVLDTDSESDMSILQSVQKRKNPFLKRNRDDSYAYLRQDGKTNQDKKVISMLEKEVLEGENKSENMQKKELSVNNQAVNQSSETRKTSNVNINVSWYGDFIESDDLQIIENPQTQKSLDTASEITKNDSNKTHDISTSDHESQNVTIDETQMSMYSRYKKSNQHNNSIHKYRNSFNFELEKGLLKQKTNNSNEKKDFDSSSATISRKILLKSNTTETSKTVIEDITLVYDSDDELQNNSGQKKSYNQNNSNLSLEENNDKSDSTSYLKQTQAKNASISSIDIADEEISKIMNSPLTKESTSHYIDLSQDSDEENNCSYNKRCNSKSVTNENNQKESSKIEEKKDDCDKEVDKISQPIPELINLDENLSNENNKSLSHKTTDSKDDKKQREVINLSPVSIISVSQGEQQPCNDLGEFQKNSSKTKESKICSDSNKRNDFEFGSLESEWFDDTGPCANWASKSRSETNIRNKSKSPDPNLDIINISENSPSKLHTSPQPSTSKNITTSPISVSPILSHRRKIQANEIVRKFHVRSASTSTFKETENISGTTLQRSSSFETPKKNRLEQKSCENVASSKDFSILETPELHKELNKFGLKPQNRKNSKKLLMHIHAELAKKDNEKPASKKRRSSSHSSSEDEEPPLKKTNVKGKLRKDTAKEKNKPTRAPNSQACSVIAEEMDYNDPDAANTLEDSVSIKDAFCRLMKTNQELSNKVLTYEPLPLESVHLKLKQKGFKCKMNSLMDFLDEQCITFQAQSGKNDDKKKKET